MRRVLIQGSKFLHPIKEGGGVYGKESFGQPFDHLGIAQPVAEIPAHGQTDNAGRKGMTRKGSPSQSGKRSVALHTTIDLCAAPVTAVPNNILLFTMRTLRAWFPFDFAGHCPQRTLSRHSPTKPFLLLSLFDALTGILASDGPCRFEPSWIPARPNKTGSKPSCSRLSYSPNRK